MQVDSHSILVFAAGILAVVLLAGIIVGVTAIIWARNSSRASGGSQDLDPKQLHFAAAILTGLGLIFSLSMAMLVWGGERGKEVFDACKTAIPPIVTLVLGYYFGRERIGPTPGAHLPP
jgi:Na+/H+ antiporter NhaA